MSSPLTPTVDDSRIVSSILLKRHDFYAVLLVQRTSTEAEIKLAYKKLALKCHPDKNCDARASEAFKVLSTAQSILTDANKRRIFDEYGVEGLQRQESTGSPHPPRQDPYRRAYAQQRGHPFQQHGFQHHQFEPVELNINALLPIFIALVVFMVFSMSSSLFIDGGDTGARRHSQRSIRSIVSLTQSKEQGFIVQRSTTFLAEHGIKAQYFVRAGFYDTMKRSGLQLRDVETEVLRWQAEYLQNRCNSEMIKRASKKARHGDDDDPQVCKDARHIQRFLG